jgi:hypothetical protein
MILNGLLPKKNENIRGNSDFRKLCSLLKRHPFKKFGGIQSVEGFIFAGYYHIKLDSVSQELRAILCLAGKDKYTYL